MDTLIELFKALLFGAVEGITEWLPVSSTGHIILLNGFVKFDIPGTAAEQAAFMEFFDVAIQLGAILAVVILFFKQIWPFGIEDRDAEVKLKVGDLESHVIRICGPLIIKKDILFLWIKIAVACLPGFAYGVLLDDMVETLTGSYKTIIVAVMLILVGILFIIVESVKKNERPRVRKISDISYLMVIVTGVAQVIAGVLPGTSRSGATIIAGLLMGLSRTVAAEFTFFLAIPTMFGASLLKLIKFLKNGMTFSGMEIAVLSVSSIVAFAVSLLALNFLMGYVKKHDFKVFGWYRIVLGLAVLGLVLGGVLR